MNEQLEQAMRDIAGHFGRHFVSVAGTYFILDDDGKPSGTEKCFNYSGMVLSIRGFWNILTAGHILQDLERKWKANRIRLNCSFLLDNYGVDRKTNLPTPFL